MNNHEKMRFAPDDPTDAESANIKEGFRIKLIESSIIPELNDIRYSRKFSNRYTSNSRYLNDQASTKFLFDVNLINKIYEKE